MGTDEETDDEINGFLADPIKREKLARDLTSMMALSDDEKRAKGEKRMLPGRVLSYLMAEELRAKRSWPNRGGSTSHKKVVPRSLADLIRTVIREIMGESLDERELEDRLTVSYIIDITNRISLI